MAKYGPNYLPIPPQKQKNSRLQSHRSAQVLIALRRSTAILASVLSILHLQMKSIVHKKTQVLIVNIAAAALVMTLLFVRHLYHLLNAFLKLIPIASELQSIKLISQSQ
jgi:hypothetical protein